MPLPSEQKLSEHELKEAKELFDAVAGGKDKITLDDFKRALKIAGFQVADKDAKVRDTTLNIYFKPLFRILR